MQKESTEETIEYLNIEFGRLGSWHDYSECDVYPYGQMLAVTLPRN